MNPSLKGKIFMGSQSFEQGLTKLMVLTKLIDGSDEMSDESD